MHVYAPRAIAYAYLGEVYSGVRSHRVLGACHRLMDRQRSHGARYRVFEEDLAAPPQVRQQPSRQTPNAMDREQTS